MALFDDLKTAIKQAIKPNNAQEITGQTLQNTLLQMVDDLGTMPPEDFEAWKGQVTEQIEDCATKEEVTQQLGDYATKEEVQPLANIAKGVITLNGQYDILDQYNSIDKKGWYALTGYDSGILKDFGGFMLVTSDDMGHVIHQFIFSDYTVMDGEIGSHQDGTPSIVVRTYNVNSSIKDIPKGTWGKWTNYFGLSRQTGYAECTSTANEAGKLVHFSDYREFVLSLNCRILVKMEQGNNAANPTMNIDNTGDVPLYYNGSPASASNTWQAGDILDVFYDGTNYQACKFGVQESGTGNEYKPVILTMTTLAGKDELRGVTYNDLYDALSNGYIVIVIDKERNVNYVVNAEFNPFAMTICNIYGKCVRLVLTQRGSAILYTETELPQAGDPLLLEVQGNNMPLAGTTTTMRDISLAITNKQPLYVNYNNKTNRVIAYDPIQSGSITLYYHDVGYKGIVRVDLIGEDTAVPTSRLTPMPKDYDNAALVLDVSNCWHTTSGTSQQYQNVDLGATATEIKAAADGNQRIVLSKGSDRMYPVTASEMQPNGSMIICAMYLSKLCVFTIMPNSGNAQNCDVTLGVTALQPATQTGA